jgi:hypothetical protein
MGLVAQLGGKLYVLPIHFLAGLMAAGRSTELSDWMSALLISKSSTSRSSFPPIQASSPKLARLHRRRVTLPG